MPVQSHSRFTPRPPSAPDPVSADQTPHGIPIAFVVAAAILCAAFYQTLAQWVRFALFEERNSYLLIVPAITYYLIRTRRADLRRFDRRPSATSMALSALAAFLFLACSFLAGEPLTRLSLQMTSLLAFLLAAAFQFFGLAQLCRIFFPIAFLAFAIPVPKPIGDAIEIFLQYTSAEAAYWMLALLQTPMLRQGLDFVLPGLTIHVAQECSGYNSTFALFMVSTIAGYLFIQSPARRVTLSALVVPLAILRNGFRITTIAMLCVHVDPSMIHSFIHQRGGPIFFALSLIPFGAILWWLRRHESSNARSELNR